MIKKITLVLFILCLISPAISQAKDYSIMIASDTNKPYNSIIVQNIINRLADSNIRVLTNDKVEKNTQQEYNLLVTIGSQFAHEALQNPETTRPVLSLLIPELTVSQLDNKYNKTWSAQIIDQPYETQLRLINHLFGKKSRLGIILGPASVTVKDKIKQAAAITGTKVDFKEINQPDQLIPSLKNLIETNDILLAIPDPVVYNKNTIRGILLLTYRNRTPVIGFSRSYIKAGATAGIYSTPEQIASDATDNIKSFFRNNQKFNSTKLYPTQYSIETNNRVIESMQLNINIKDIKKRMDTSE